MKRNANEIRQQIDVGHEPARLRHAGHHTFPKANQLAQPEPELPASGTAPPPSLIGRVERALLLLAWFIELDGDIHVAMYERFEAELYALKQRESTKERARRLLWAAAGGRTGFSNAFLRFTPNGGS